MAGERNATKLERTWLTPARRGTPYRRATNGQDAGQADDDFDDTDVDTFLALDDVLHGAHARV